MNQNVPYQAIDKSYVGSKVFKESEGHPIFESGTLLATETFPFLAGTVVAKQTSTGKIIRYTDGESDGRGTAVGILPKQVNVETIGATPRDIIVVYGVHGIAIESKCVGLDSNAKTDLKQILFV